MNPAVQRIGRYQIQGVLGTGAFATVYRAKDERLDDTVAVKLLAENHSLSLEIRRRFLTEGKALRRIDSPHVIRVHDLGETDGQQPYLVLEHADRGTLTHRTDELRDQGWDPTTADILAVAGPLAEALEAVHTADLVHRDLNPGNVLLTTRGTRSLRIPAPPLVRADERLVLADLGLVKDLALNSGFTSAGGTEGFRPPELRSGPARIDARADLWSLSALIVWLITGLPPRDRPAARAVGGGRGPPAARGRAPPRAAPPPPPPVGGGPRAARLRHRARPRRPRGGVMATKTVKTARDVSAEVVFLTRALKAPALRESVARLAERARQESWTHEEFLVACLQREVSAREAHGGEGRIRAARFPARKSLEEFDFDHARGLKRDTIAHLGTLDFVAARDNVVFLGPPGTGKTHLAIGLAIRACQAGHRVLFATAAEWVARLAEAHHAGRLQTELTKLARIPLLVVDEVGYIPFEAEAANLFFQLVSSRYERASLIVTSNKVFGRWGEVFGEPGLGTLETGAPADLVVLEYRPPTPLEAENLAGHYLFGLGKSAVRDVMVAGRWIVRERRHLHVDEDELAARCRTAAERLWARMQRY
jgi:DNA replication protein DnaC/tRNA A-37 threonylcarbamoyl transferase component Bud32